MLRFALALGVLLQCGSVAAALEPVRLQLKWHHQFQFAGYYAAQAQGYYRDAGLDVEIVEATPGLNAVDEVVAGRAQYGVGNSGLLLSRQAGLPVVVLAVIYQHSPLVLLARTESGLGSVHDLAGKRLMLEQQSEELLAYLKHEGLAAGAFTVEPHSFDPADLISGRVDAISAYVTDEPYFLEQAKVPFQVLSPRAGGIDFYGDNLFTSDAELKTHPDRVRAFREASLRGWKYAMQHQEEIIELILARYGERHGREYLRYEAHQMQALLQPELIEMGYMYAGRWQHIVDTYAELGLLPADFSLRSLLYSAESDSLQELRRWLPALLIGTGVILVLVIAIVLVVRVNRRLGREIEAHREVSAELQARKQRFRFIAENTADVIWTLDLASNCLTYVSPSVFRLCGLTAEEVMARSVEQAVTPESAERIREALVKALARWNAKDGRDTTQVTEVDLLHKDGHVVHTEAVTTLHADASGKPFILGVSRDITERKKAEALIRDLAFFDPLTHLPNRRLLLDRLHQAISKAKREGSSLALMFIDLDRFKPVNDIHGHLTGDWLLQAVARRMQDSVRQSDTVARVGGDEFVILLPTTNNESDAVAVGEKVRVAMYQPFVMPDGPVLSVSCSIGIVFYPEHGEDEERLLRNGDAAMYQSKEMGRNRVQILSGAAFSDSDAAMLSVRLRWKNAYACGEASIDREHRQLFDLANALLSAALLRDSQPQSFKIVLEELLAHILAHFENEESILARANYTDLAAHAQEHKRLIDRALGLQAEAQSGGVSMGELVDFLAHEVVGVHILQEDRKFFGLFSKPPG